MSEERVERPPYIIYAVPPNIDPKIWADIEYRRLEVRLKEIEVEREKTRDYVELAREGMNTFKDYYLKKIPRATMPAYILIAVVVVGAIVLTWLGKISGETFAFLMGTIVGYMISLLSKQL